MLYFNRNGVWFTIPLKKDGIYDRDLLEKQIHTSLLDLQKLKDRSPDLEQMRFEKQGEYIVTSVFGKDEIVINPLSIIKKGDDKKEKEKEAYVYYPVPVFCLFNGSASGFSITWELRKFWVCFGLEWEPAILVDPETPYFAENLDYYRISENLEIYPLECVSQLYSGDGWDDSDYNEEEDHTYWSPGPNPFYIKNALDSIHSCSWTGPNLSGAFLCLDQYCAAYCTAPGWESVCQDNYGWLVTQSNPPHWLLPYSSYGDAYSWPPGVDGYDYGDTYVDTLYYYGYVDFSRRHYIIECILNTPEIFSEYVDYHYQEFEYLPIQTRKDTFIQSQTTQIYACTEDLIYSGEYTYSKIYDWKIVPTKSTRTMSIDFTHSLEGNDVYLLTDNNTDDFKWWVSVIWEYAWHATSNSGQVISHGSETVNLSDADDYAAANFRYPYTNRIFAKINGSSKEFDICSQDFSDWTDFFDAWGSARIYDFFGEPVYIIGLTIRKTYSESETVELNKYAMIYKNEIHLSDEYPPVEDKHGYCSINNSFNEMNLAGDIYACATAIKRTDKTKIITNRGSVDG